MTCPPYDIISESQRLSYLKRNPHNIIRLELPRDGEDPYAAAGDVLREWLRRRASCSGTISPPSISMRSNSTWRAAATSAPRRAGRRSVAGLIAQVHLEEFSKGIVLPHEETLSKAKDRPAEPDEGHRLQLQRYLRRSYMDDGGETEALDILALAAREQPISEIHRRGGPDPPAVGGHRARGDRGGYPPRALPIPSCTSPTATTGMRPPSTTATGCRSQGRCPRGRIPIM